MAKKKDGEPRCVSAKELVGKRIVGFHLNPFPDGRGGSAHTPQIDLEDGSYLRFIVEETDVGEYGVAIMRWGKSKPT